VAVAAWRRSAWLESAAASAATLLFVDAWFDVLTSSTRDEFVVAVVEAVLVELPLAVVCLLLARNAERRFLSRRPVESHVVEHRLQLVRASGPAGQEDRLSA
jgi:hypothetical protein